MNPAAARISARISAVTVTPVAFADPPLLNSVGVHEPFALRSIVRLDTDEGLVGWGETYADDVHLERVRAGAAALLGHAGFAPHRLRRVVADALGAGAGGGDGVAGMITGASAVDRVFSPFEVACLDVQGKAVGRPVADLLGGVVRDPVPYSAYLFYKWAAHPGGEPDEWGEALTPDQLVAQARRMIGGRGLSAR